MSAGDGDEGEEGRETHTKVETGTSDSTVDVLLKMSRNCVRGGRRGGDVSLRAAGGKRSEEKGGQGGTHDEDADDEADAEQDAVELGDGRRHVCERGRQRLALLVDALCAGRRGGGGVGQRTSARKREEEEDGPGRPRASRAC